MARLFDNASSEYLEIDSAPVTAYPFTLSCWFNMDAAAGSDAISIADASRHNSHWSFIVNAGLTVNFYARGDTDGGASATTTNTATVDTWSHFCGLAASSTDRTCVLDGDTANKGTSATDVTPDGPIDRIAIGRRGDVSPGQYYSGSIAEVAVWDVALSEAEAIALSKGAPTLSIRPGNLVFYAPLFNTEDEDFVGGLSLTAFNTPTTSYHPPVSRPTAQILQFAAGAAASSGVVHSIAGPGGIAGEGGIAGKHGGIAG